MLFRKDEDVVAIGSAALMWQCAACLFQPCSVSANMLFQSIGKSAAAFLASLRSGAYFIPLILILPVFSELRNRNRQPIADLLSFVTSMPFLIAFLKKLPRENEEK